MENLGPVRVAVLRRPNAPEPTSSLFSQAGVTVLDLPLATGDQEALSVMGQALASSCSALVLDLDEDDVAEQLTTDSRLPVVLASQATLIRNTAATLLAAVQLEAPFEELKIALGGQAASAVGDVLVQLGLPEEQLHTLTSGAAELPEGTHLLLLPEQDLDRHEQSGNAEAVVGLVRGDGGLVLPALARAAADTDLPLDAERCGAVARALASLGADCQLPDPDDARLVPTLAAAATSKAGYRAALEELTSPLRRALRSAVDTAREKIRRLIFVDGEAPGVIAAARQLVDEGLAVPYLLGDLFRLESLARDQGLTLKGIKVFNPKRDKWRAPYAKALHEALGRELGIDLDHTSRLVEDPRVFAALTVAQGEAHALVALGERGDVDPLGPALRLLERRPGARALCEATLVATADRTLVVAQAADPTSEELALAALQGSKLALTLLGTEPRVALLAHTSYGQGDRELERIARARQLVALRAPELKVDGPLEIEAALDVDLQESFYEFCSLEGPANVLVVPGRTATHVTLGALQQLAGAELLGPIMWGLRQPAGLAPHGSSANQLVLLAAVTAAHAVDAEAERAEPSALQRALKTALAEAAKTTQTPGTRSRPTGSLARLPAEPEVLDNPDEEWGFRSSVDAAVEDAPATEPTVELNEDEFGSRADTDDEQDATDAPAAEEIEEAQADLAEEAATDETDAEDETAVDDDTAADGEDESAVDDDTAGDGEDAEDAADDTTADSETDDLAAEADEDDETLVDGDETHYDGEDEDEGEVTVTGGPDSVYDTSSFKPRISLGGGSSSEAESRSAESHLGRPPSSKGLISFGAPSKSDDDED